MKTSDLGAEKGLLQSRENAGLVLKSPKLPDGLGESVFIDKIQGKVCRLRDFRPIGGWRGDLAGQCSRNPAQPEVSSFHLGRGAWFCRGAPRYCSVYPWRRTQDPAPSPHGGFLPAPPWSLHPLPSLIGNYLNLPFGAQGRSETYFLQTRHWGHTSLWPRRTVTGSCFILVSMLENRIRPGILVRILVSYVHGSSFLFLERLGKD